MEAQFQKMTSGLRYISIKTNVDRDDNQSL